MCLTDKFYLYTVTAAYGHRCNWAKSMGHVGKIMHKEDFHENMLIYKLWWLQMLFFVLVLTPRCWTVDVSCISSCTWQLTQAARAFAIALKPVGGVVSAANTPQCQLTLPQFEPAVSTAGNRKANASLKETPIWREDDPSAWNECHKQPHCFITVKSHLFICTNHSHPRNSGFSCVLPSIPFLGREMENLMTWQICVFVACSNTIVHQLWTTLKRK